MAICPTMIIAQQIENFVHYHVYTTASENINEWKRYAVKIMPIFLEKKKYLQNIALYQIKNNNDGIGYF